MKAKDVLARQGHRLLQVGVGLFVFTAIQGFVIPSTAPPRLGLSLHTLGAIQALMWIGLGLIWPRLKISTTAGRIALWTNVYSGIATLMPYVLGAFWKAGNKTIPLAAGNARGTDTQETIILMVMISASVPFFVSMAIVIWGLRLGKSRAQSR